MEILIQLKQIVTDFEIHYKNVICDWIIKIVLHKDHIYTVTYVKTTTAKSSKKHLVATQQTKTYSFAQRITFFYLGSNIRIY